jgi:SAM-dependent methyltransferase
MFSGHVDRSPLPVRLVKDAIPARYRTPVLGTFRSLWYAGDNVDCPCCGGHFRKFRLDETACPRCGSHGRHRLLWLYFDSHSDLLATAGSLLHLAPEHCLIRRLSCIEGLRYVTADLDSPLADERVDIRCLPYKDDSFGAVLCSHVLEQVDDDRRAMQELLRVLRPGGWAMLMAPVESHRETTFEDPGVTDEAERVRLFGQKERVRAYGRDIATRLEQAGFTVTVDYFRKHLPDDEVRRMRLDIDQDDIFFCRKS